MRSCTSSFFLLPPLRELTSASVPHASLTSILLGARRPHLNRQPPNTFSICPRQASVHLFACYNSSPSGPCPIPYPLLVKQFSKSSPRTARAATPASLRLP